MYGRCAFAGEFHSEFPSDADVGQGIKPGLGILSEDLLHGQGRAHIGTALEDLLEPEGPVATLRMAGVGHARAPSGRLVGAVSGIQRVARGDPPGLEHGHEARQLEGGSGLYGRAECVVIGLGALTGLGVPDQVGDGHHVAGRDLHDHGAPPFCLVLAELGAQRVGGDILGPEVEGGSDIESGLGGAQEIVGGGDPVIAVDPAHPALAGLSGEGGVVGGFDAHAVALGAMQADGAVRQWTEGLVPAGFLGEHEARSILAPSVNPGKGLHGLAAVPFDVAGDGHVAAGAGSVGVEQEVAPASCAALPEFPAAGFGQRGQGGEEVGFFLLSVDDRGIPMQVEPGHAGGEEMALRGEDAAPFRLDGAQLGQHGLAGLVLRVELHQHDARDDADAEEGEEGEDEPGPGGDVLGALHGLVGLASGKRTGGESGAVRFTSAMASSRRLRCS